MSRRPDRDRPGHDRHPGGGVRRTLHVVTDAYRPVPSHHPHPGWVEKDAEAVITSVRDAVAEVVASVGAEAITAAGLDNEGETVVAWDAHTLRPLAPAMVWSCRRSEQSSSGCVPKGSRSGCARWPAPRSSRTSRPRRSPGCSKTSPAVQAAAAAGPRALRTLDAYVLARLGDGARTEPSTAARTQLQAIAAPGRWDPELCQIFGVDPEALPPIRDSIGELGSIAGLPLRAMLVDQTAALAGHGCVSAGATKATYGTGVFLLAHAGADVPGDPAGLLPTVPGRRRGDRLRPRRRRVLGRRGRRLVARLARLDRERRRDARRWRARCPTPPAFDSSRP